MSPRSRLTGAIAVAATAAVLLLPGTTYARVGDQTFQQTYRNASRLCSDIAKGVGHPLLRKSAPQVLADCAALESSFNAARAQLLAKRSALTAAIAPQRAARKPACVGVRNTRACRRSHHQALVTINALLLQRSKAELFYLHTLELNRTAFWHGIRKLRGGSLERPDAPIKARL